jgi:hypothetical protein
VPALETIHLLHVVANPAALDGARWFDADAILRTAPDEILAIGPVAVLVDDDDAIVVDDYGFVGAWLDLASIEPHAEWPLPTERPALAQGSIAGVPAKVWLPDDGRALLITAAPYAHELSKRIRWGR